MVVKSIFPEVKYPNDRDGIKYIIKEYEKVLEYKLYGPYSKTKKSGYIINIIVILAIMYAFECSWISVWIRALYIIPSTLSIIYNIVLFIKIKKSSYRDEKTYYKFKNSDAILVVILIYVGTFMFQTFLFGKWSNKDYLISFGILAFFSLVTFIKVRIEAPKKFIKQYLHTNNKIPSYNTIIIAIVQLLVSIAYFQKPYFLILILSYILLVVASGFIAYGYFEYLQYDKIQQLKKQINYIPDKKINDH